MASTKPDPWHYRRMRGELNLTQREFCDRYGIPLKTYRNWEQGIRTPSESELTYLKVIYTIPSLVDVAINGRR